MLKVEFVAWCVCLMCLLRSFGDCIIEKDTDREETFLVFVTLVTGHFGHIALG